MFQLIVSVIAIALFAVLAAASIYYGGPAFSNASAKGNVAALINAGQQIAGANALYKVDATTSAATISDLVSNYLSAIPTPPPFASGTWALDTTSTVAYIGPSANAKAQVCTEVGNQGGASAATQTGSAPAAGDLPANQFGCVGDFFAYKL
jgi:type II secretory pathway pseudopilin PulG